MLSGLIPALALVFAITASPSPDFNNDGQVNVSDLLILLAHWGECDQCPYDLTGNGHVNVSDLLVLLSNWGPVTTGYFSAPRYRDLDEIAIRLIHGDARLMVIGDSINNPNAIGSGTNETDTNTPKFYGRQQSWLPTNGWTGAMAQFNQGTRPQNANGTDLAQAAAGGGHSFPQRIPNGTTYTDPLLKDHSYSGNLTAGPASSWGWSMGNGNYGIPWLHEDVQALVCFKPHEDGVEELRLIGMRGTSIIVETAFDQDFSGTGPATSIRINCGSHPSEPALFRTRDNLSGYDESGKVVKVIWRGMVRPSAKTGICMSAIAYGGWGILDHLNNYGLAELTDLYQALSVDAAGVRKTNTLLIELGQNHFYANSHKALMEQLIDKHRNALIDAGVDPAEILILLVTGVDQGDAPVAKSTMAVLNDEIAQERSYVGHLNLFRIMFEEHGSWDDWKDEFTPPGDNHPNTVGAIEQARLEWETFLEAAQNVLDRNQPTR